MGTGGASIRDPGRELSDSQASVHHISISVCSSLRHFFKPPSWRARLSRMMAWHMTARWDHGSYIPALAYKRLTPLYDPLIRWTLRESAFKLRLIEQARLERTYRVLDLGCGTGTLALLIKKAHPDSDVVGLDADPEALETAKAKTAKARVQITLDQGMCFDLPYPDDSFDRVLSSLVFHHLSTEQKLRTLREVFRVLRPGSQLHVADWGKPQGQLMRLAFLTVQMLDGFATTTDNVKGLLPEFFRGTGFQDVNESAQFMTLFGTLSLYRARKPGPKAHSDLLPSLTHNE